MFIFLFRFQTVCISGEREEKPVAPVFSFRYANVLGNQIGKGRWNASEKIKIKETADM